MLRNLALLICIHVVSQSLCQERAEKALRQQLNFICDNNFLLFNGDDGYYTSGMFLKYDRVSEKITENRKEIFSYELGQLIYTAYSRKILPVPSSQFPGGVDQIDRPIAGYLYGKVSRTLFYDNRKMFSLGVSVGTIGEHSLGRTVQESWHKVIGVKDYWNWVWDYQVKNEVGINLHASYAQSLIDLDRHSFFQITPVSHLTLGTTFIYASQGALFQVGNLRSIVSSSFWNSRIQTEPSSAEKRVELFFFYKPEIKYQLYNATIQGGLFRSDKGEITSTPKSFVFSQAIGITFSAPRYSITYQVVFQGKEAANQFKNQAYASLVMAYRF